MSLDPKEYNPSPLSELFETSLMGSLQSAAERIRMLKKLNPEATNYAIAKVLKVSRSQVASALRVRADGSDK